MPKIISRKEWGARYRPDPRAASTPARRVWAHHSVTVAPDLEPPFTDDDEAMRTLERVGHSRFGYTAPYNFAITPSGRIYEGCPLHRRGQHTKGLNSTDRAVVFIGNYQGRPLPRPAILAAANLLADGRRAGWWAAPAFAGGHRNAPDPDTGGKPTATACPGDGVMAALPEINRLAASRWRWLLARLKPKAKPAVDRVPPWPREGFLVRPGERHAIVRTWASRMRARGWTVDVVEVMTARNVAALRGFQGEKGLRVDGILGPASFRAAWTAPVSR